MPRASEQINEIKQKLADFVPIMDGLSRARNPFELRYFVIGKHDDRVQQYKQAVIEMDSKYKAVIEALHGQKLRALEREEKEAEFYRTPVNRIQEIKNERIRIEIAKLDREEHDAKIAMTGAFKEVMDFITIIENEFADLVEKTEEELLQTEVEHWKKRFAKQIAVDLLTIGKVGEGNRSAMLMMPQQVQEEILAESMFRAEEIKRLDEKVAKATMIKLAESYPHKTTYIAPPDYVPLKLRKDAPDGYPRDRIVEIDRAEFMIATMHREGDDWWISENFIIPTGKNNIKHWITGMGGEDMVGEKRNRIVKDAISLGCEYLFFVDDDLVVPQDALQKLYALNLDIVGGWYPKKTPIPESATMISVPGSASMQPVPHNTTGVIEVDWALTGGCTLIKMDVFKRIPYPWYLTTAQGTEDTYFSARCREVGIKQYLDTSIKCGHVDKATGDEYTFDGINRGKVKRLT